MRRSSFAIVLATSAAAFVTISDPANARGCGGYVNIMQWGCAPWDNNPPKPGVTPGYPAKSVAKPVEHALPPVAVAPRVAPVVSNDGGSIVSHDSGTIIGHDSGSIIGHDSGSIISHDSGSVVATGGGNLINTHGSKLVGNDSAGVVATGGGNVVATGGGNLVGSKLVGNDSAGVVATGGGNVVATGGGNLIGHDGASLIGHDGASLTGPPVGFVPRGPSDYRAAPADAGPSQAMLDAQKASDTVLKASDLVKRDTLDLLNARKANDQGLAGQLQAKLDADNKTLAAAGVTLAAKSTLVEPKDVPAAQALITDTVKAVQRDTDVAKAAVTTAAAPAQPSALQVATANAAAAKAQDAANAAAQANSGVQALVATLGSRPSNPDDLAKVNRAMAASAVTTAQSDLAKAQADLVKMSANKASPGDIQSQKDLIAKAQSNLTFQQGMVANDYAGKRIAADVADTDLTKAKAVVDGLTKAYGSNRPADPQANATITAAMVVQALAQDKADQAAADAQAARLIAAGASKNDIQVQKDLSAAKAKDIAGILKVNPQVLAAAGVSASTDPAIVAKAISGVVATAAKQTTAAVQQTTAAVQQANAAVQQAKATPAPAPVINVPTDTATALVSSLKKTGDTLSSMSVNKPTAVASTAPALPGSTAAPASAPVAGAGSKPAAVANAAPAASAAPATSEAPAPAKITADQAKALHQALRTIPGDLTKSEQKSFGALAAMVDRASTKGLTPEEAGFLKEGLTALAEKHPKAEKQQGLTTIANAVGSSPKPAAGVTAPSGTVPAAVVVPGVTVPTSGSKPTVATTTPAGIGQPNAEKPSPSQATRTDPKPTVATTTPAGAAPANAGKPSPSQVTHTDPAKPTVATTTPAGAVPANVEKSSPSQVTHTDPAKPTVAATTPTTNVRPDGAKPVPSQGMQAKPATQPNPVQAVHTEPAKPQPVQSKPAPVQAMQAKPAPQPSPPPAAKPAAPALAAAAPAKPPAPKVQTCRPNMQMVNGHMTQVGQICN